MRRFAQKDEKIPGQEPSWEKEEQDAFLKNIKEIQKSNSELLQFCRDLKSAGAGLKQVATKVPPIYAFASAGLVSIGSKFEEIGDNVIGIINTKQAIELASNVAGYSSSLYQPTSKTPGLKRFIPFAGDIINFNYTTKLTLQKDLIEPIENIFAPYKCDKNHPPTNAPLMKGLEPNFFDHPELDDQYRAKTQAISELTLNLGAQLQNFEAALAYIATVWGQIEAVVAIRTVGGLIQGFLTLLSAAFSPNTADIFMYGGEGFEGGGIDPNNPLSVLNKVPGISKYIQKYESKAIAQEAKDASEKTPQNFTLIELYQPNLVQLMDNFGEVKSLLVGEKWPKYGITITFVGDDHAEYKDQLGYKYSIRKTGPLYATPEVSITDKKGTAFRGIMKDAANLSTSGVKGDVDKLLSKKASDIISLMYQLKNKYPWIGDSKNAKWINLQSDILTHLIRKPKKRKPMPKLVATSPKPTGVPNLREISLDNYKQKYFREDQSQLIPERRGSAVRVKLQEVMDAIKSGTLSNTNWDKWSDIGKQAIIEEAIDRLQNAGFNVLGPRLDRRMGFVPPISKDILDQLSPKYKSSR